MTDPTPNPVSPIAALQDREPSKPPRSQWRDVWDQFKHHKGALIGGGFFFFILLAVFVGPYFWTIDPSYIDIRARNSGPSLAHPSRPALPRVP